MTLLRLGAQFFSLLRSQPQSQPVASSLEDVRVALVGLQRLEHASQVSAPSRTGVALCQKRLAAQQAPLFAPRPPTGLPSFFGVEGPCKNSSCLVAQPAPSARLASSWRSPPPAASTPRWSAPLGLAASVQEADAAVDQHALEAEAKPVQARQPLRRVAGRQAPPGRAAGAAADHASCSTAFLPRCARRLRARPRRSLRSG